MEKIIVHIRLLNWTQGEVYGIAFKITGEQPAVRINWGDGTIKTYYGQEIIANHVYPKDEPLLFIIEAEILSGRTSSHDRITELTRALNRFANLVPYLNNRYFNMSEERYEDAPNGRHCSFDELCNRDKTIARRILSTLRNFATLSVFTPQYFKQIYHVYPLPDSARTKDYNSCNECDKALEAMLESWSWILERKPTIVDGGWEDVSEKIYYGLHLFAEYLPEMQND